LVLEPILLKLCKVGYFRPHCGSSYLVSFFPQVFPFPSQRFPQWFLLFFTCWPAPPNSKSFSKGETRHPEVLKSFVPRNFWTFFNRPLETFLPSVGPLWSVHVSPELCHKRSSSLSSFLFEILFYTSFSLYFSFPVAHFFFFADFLFRISSPSNRVVLKNRGEIP